MKNLPVVWTKHLKDSQSKTDLENTVRASRTALERLYQILEEKEGVVLRTEITLSDFDQPNWAHKQAFRNGQRAALKEIRELLEFIKG
jgi:hypothetical protein